MSSSKPNLQYKTRSGNNWTAALSCEMHCQWHSTNLKGCHFIPDQILFGLSKYSCAFSKGLESRVVPHLKNDQAVVQTLWKLCLTFVFCFFSQPNLTLAVSNTSGEGLYAWDIFWSQSSLTQELTILQYFYHPSVLTDLGLKKSFFFHFSPHPQNLPGKVKRNNARYCKMLFV